MIARLKSIHLLRHTRQAVLRQPLWKALQNLRFELRVYLYSLRNQSKLENIEHQNNLKVNLGCGVDIRDKWLNIDILPSHISANSAFYVAYDFRRGLPLPANSCQLIYSSHVWEHLDYATGLQLFQESYRCLASNGVFRIALPNMHKIFQAYIEQDFDYFNLLSPNWLAGKPQVPILVDYVNYAVYQGHEHKYIYDTEKLIQTLTQVGFQKIRETQFDADIDIDTPLRRKYSFYMEAQKV